MTATDLCFVSATELSRRIRAKDVSPVEATDAYLARIAERQPQVNAYVAVLDESARREARASEARVARGEALGPLDGVPIAIKDGNARRGAPSTGGSRLLAANVATETVSHVARLERSGAVVLGVTNTPEFGHKGSTDNLVFGPTRLPFDLSKNAGGSSGGSAAAVADGCAALALGGDGGGSIRIPASMCGIYGLLSTFGRLPIAVRPDGFSCHAPFGFLGPLARTVDDAVLMARVLAGPDTRDPFTLPETADPFDHVGVQLGDLRAAYLPTFGGFAVVDEVAAPVASAVERLAELGLGVESPEFDFGGLTVDEVIAAWTREWTVSLATQLRLLERSGLDPFGADRDRLDPAVARLAEDGLRASAVELRLSELDRARVLDALEAIFERFDVILTPTSGVPAFDNADDGMTTGPTEVAGQATEPLGGWALTCPVNMAGYPAASVPAGTTPDGLPVGMQVIGRKFEERTVLAVSAAVERALPWDRSFDRLR